LLRAIAERLIPGIPEETRIAILQQTNAGDAVAQGDTSSNKNTCPGPTVLEEVIDKATARSELEKEIKGECGISSSPYPTAMPLTNTLQSYQVESVPTMDMLLCAPLDESGTRGCRRSSSC
jgi:hypothetical protein